ncbi:MAG: hypothetical protein ACK5CE_09560 [Actinomycetes bacterium]|jgi:hypothetical protein
MGILLITLDTNEVDPGTVASLRRAIGDFPHQISVVTVTQRERGHGAVMEALAEITPVRETAVWGESRWDEAVWGFGDGGSVPEGFVVGESRVGDAQLVGAGVPDLESILRIITNGSFPKVGSRETLTDTQRRQLRDAMILQAHSREKRHVLISEDKAFGPTTRDRLEALCSTKLRNRAEFIELAQQRRLAELLPESM